jgi:two-component system, chemotaxis family, chemotaxis protein CheY
MNGHELAREADARLLVVDDLEEIREGVASMLAEVGFANVDAAADGAEALELLRRARYYLVITDWCMPVLDGRGLLLALRAEPEHATTPVLVMSASNTVLNAVEVGADGVITKPFTFEQLSRAVDRVLGRGPMPLS